MTQKDLKLVLLLQGSGVLHDLRGESRVLAAPPRPALLCPVHAAALAYQLHFGTLTTPLSPQLIVTFTSIELFVNIVLDHFEMLTALRGMPIMYPGTLISRPSSFAGR